MNTLRDDMLHALTILQNAQATNTVPCASDISHLANCAEMLHILIGDFWDYRNGVVGTEANSAAGLITYAHTAVFENLAA